MILGAGYAGLVTAIRLEEKTKQLNDVEIVLVDKNDYHQFLHLAYEIITNVKKPSDLTIPLNELLQNRKIRFLQATVREIDVENRLIRTDKGDLPYHELVIALGSEPNYYGIEGAAENSFCISSTEAAVEVRDKLKTVLTQEKAPSIVIGGGGFTGVEVAGEILDEYDCCVTIVEASEALVPSWNIPEFSEKVKTVLADMGARFIFGRHIVKVKPEAIILDSGGEIECSLFIWTGGVQTSRVASRSGLKIGKSSRLVINEFCEAVEHPGVYVVGDCALVVDPKTGEALPQCVEIALQQAGIVAENVFEDIVGGKKIVYVPRFSGLILAVGERYGVGRIFDVKVEGRLAQMVKRLIHLRYVYDIAGLGEAFKELV